MKKIKLLCILHRSPPNHGASKVGDFITKSEKLQKEFECKFITIKSSNTIGDIGKINLKKIYLVIELYIKILVTLIYFRPNKIYFTASISSVAFYRDVLLSTLWKCYKLFKKTDIYYHYHTKGINQFVSVSSNNLNLTNFFLRDINLILLSPLLKEDFVKITTYKKILYLPNGIKDTIKEKNIFNQILNKKFSNAVVQVLYLNHLIDMKGYKEALFLAKKFPNILFNFAGSFGTSQDEKYFFSYIEKNDLKNIKYHGFVTGNKKDTLLKISKLIVYLSKNDAFPLTLLEALSYGLPALTTNQGSIPYIIKDSGIILKSLNKKELVKSFNQLTKNYLNKNHANYCRKRYINNFSLKQFEKNLIEVFK